MKVHALCAMVTILTLGVKAMLSNTRGVRGQHHASLLREFHRHLDPVPDHDVGPLLKSAEAMLMDMASRHAGTPLADLVEQIRPFILQMQDSIRAAHTSAQQTLTNFAADFSGCTSAKSTGESEATSLENTKKEHSDDHKACRTLQKNAHEQFSTCESTLNNLEDAKDSSCQLYADAERAPGCGAIPPNPGETWKSYVTRAATWFASERDSYLHKEEVCNNDTAKLQAQTTTCLGSDGSSGQKKEFEDKKEDCDAIQSQQETATCSYVSKVDDSCESFASCTNTVADGYEAQLTGMQTLEAQRKVEWNATERLLCMLGAYGADGSVDATKLQTCQLIGDNTSHLNLNYPTPTPRPGPCPGLLPHPCGADYISQEYGGLDAPAAECTACAFPGASNGPAAGSAPGAWLHLNVATIAATASDDQQIHNWPAADDPAKDFIAHDANSDVVFKTSGPFSGRPAIVFTDKHKLCTQSSYPVIQELTVFWKGSFDSARNNDWSHLVGQDHDTYWVLRKYSSSSKVTMHTRNANKPNTDMLWDEPIIVVGTVAGGTRTTSVYSDATGALVSSETTTDSNTIPAGSAPICIGLSERYFTSAICRFRGEFEQVVVYDKLLTQNDITQVVNSLQNNQVPAAVA